MDDARVSVTNLFETCDAFWKAVETKVYTKTGNAESERRLYYDARLSTKKVLKKLSDKDAAQAVFDVFPKERLPNVTFNADTTDDIANQVAFLLTPKAYGIFKLLPSQ